MPIDWNAVNRVRAGEKPPVQTTDELLERPDTPGVVLHYNLDPVLVSGQDQGGDSGHYAFYYRVELLLKGEKIL